MAGGVSVWGPPPSHTIIVPLLGPVRIRNILEGCGAQWHIETMSVMRKRTWSSLGVSLLLAISLSACGILPTISGDKKSDSAAADSSVVQSLQRQIREREKRIVELESQLDALKVIDEDMEQRRKSNRPPATLTPVD